MIDAKLYVEKNKNLDCTFTCIAYGDKVNRFRISDKVEDFVSIKRDGSDYIINIRYADGTIDEEYLELGYLFGSVGLPKEELKQIKEVSLA